MWGLRSNAMSAERAERLLARSDLSETTLRNILYRAPEPYKERAWRRLLPLNPYPANLSSVLYSGSAKYRVRVANRMIAAGVGLKLVLHHAPAWIRKKAARVLLAREPTDKELWLIIITVPEPYRGKAWRRLFNKGTTRETRQWLLDRMTRLPKLYQKRAKELFNAEADLLLVSAPKELILLLRYLSDEYSLRLRDKLFADAAAKHTIFRDAPETMQDILKEKLLRGTPPLEVIKECLQTSDIPADFKGQIADWILGRSLPRREEYYVQILRYAPEPWKERAWEMLTTDSRRASKVMRELYWQIPDAYKERYAEWIFAHRPDDNFLLSLILSEYTETFRVEAARRLLLGTPHEADLRAIANHAPEPYASQARERLAALSSSN